MIKVVISDGNGTLQLPNPSDEMKNLIVQLLSKGVKIAVASNSNKTSIKQRFKKAGLPEPCIIVTPEDLGNKKKPAPDFIYKVRDTAQVKLNEIVYIGDDDRTDILCAINARILPIAAVYSPSKKSLNYGLPFDKVEDLQDYLFTFGMQGNYFGWIYSSSSTDVRALIGDHTGLTETLKKVLKEQKDIEIGSTRKISVRNLLFLYLITQCYLSGLIINIDWITIYPGHSQNSLNSTLHQYSESITRIFREKFVPDLILRHKDAPESKFQGKKRNIFDQFMTIKINSKYQKKIQGKSILVLDDFTTSGYSLETARCMLLKAGAQSVTCLAIAKFRRTYSMANVRKNWNPFEPCFLDKKDITVSNVIGQSNDLADRYFKKQIWNFYATR